jgi:putative serine protease PepD
MTAGYDPSDPVEPDAPGTPRPFDRPRHADISYDDREGEGERLGPLPPRMASGPSGHTATLSLPGPGMSPPGPPGPAMIPPPPPSAAPHGIGPAPWPAQTSTFPSAGGPPGFAGPPPPPPARQRRGGRLGVVAFVLVVLLLAVTGVQAYTIYQLNEKLDDTNTSLGEAREANNARLEGLEGRAKELERKAGASLDAAAVAEGVLPSVFRVSTPFGLGTAFALGKAPAGGGTDLITNFHVVEEHYQRGGRDVALERRGQRFTAQIIRVDPGRDLAVVHSDEQFPRLAAATTTPKVGEPLLAVGAPLGLEDSVTVGVLSALNRETSDGLRHQFDAPINPGNSGGPVVNAQQQVIGVAVAKARESEGIGLAIPIAIVCEAFGIC